MTTSTGVLTFTLTNGNLGYSFEQTTAFDGHDDAADRVETDLAHSFTITIEDSDGSSVTSDPIEININDDGPAVGVDVVINNVTENADGSLNASTMVEFEFGADSADGKSITLDGITYEYTDGKGWSSDNGSTFLDANDGLIFGDTTLTQNGDSNFWTLEMNGDATYLEASKEIIVTDSDGDPASFEVSANADDPSPSGEIIGLAGESTFFTPGEDVNAVFVIDTSASMWDNYHNGVINETAGSSDFGYTRLDATIDALINFIKGDLLDHTKDGAEVNLYINQFWGNGTNGQEIIDMTLTAGNVDDVIAALEELRFLKYEELTIDANYDITAYTEPFTTFINQDGNTIYINEDGFPLNAKLDSAGLPQYNRSSSNTDYHHGTHYSKGFNDVADNFLANADTSINTEVFILTDGVPSGDVSADKALEKIESYDNVNINALGMGAGANETVLDRYDTDGEASTVTDADITDIFNLDGGQTNTLDSTHIGFTQDGNDVLLGDVNLEKLRELLGISDPTSASHDKQIIDFLRNNPEWMLDQENLDKIEYKDANDDALIAGEGDDLVYGQGGNDILIGDGDTSALETLAAEVGASGDYTHANATDATDANLAQTTEDLVEGLWNAVTDADGNVTKEGLAELKSAATLLETSEDGNDVIYGGDGNDIILAGGGDDVLIGGKGDDILIGGSGADKFKFADADLGGNDIILDFKLSEGDVLDLTGITNRDIEVNMGNDDDADGIVDLEIIINKGTSEEHGITLQDVKASDFDTDAMESALENTGEFKI